MQRRTHAEPAHAQRPQLRLRLFYQGMSFFRPFLCLLVDSLLLSTFFLSAAFCASVADCGSVPVAGVDVAVLVPDVPLSLAVGGGTASVAGGADVDVLDEVVAGSAGGAVPVELLVGGGVADSGETVWMLMFCCVDPALPASLTESDAEAAPCGDSISPGGFKSGAPVWAAIATFGLLFMTPMAR